MQPHVTALTLAVPLAAMSALLGMALLWQTRRHYRLQHTGRPGDAPVLTFFSALLSVCNSALFVGFLWMVAQTARFGINPDLGVGDPGLCPPRPPQGPRYPCDPSPVRLWAVNEVQLMWCLLVIGLAWYALSVWMLIAGRRVGKRSGQQGTTPSE